MQSLTQRRASVDEIALYTPVPYISTEQIDLPEWYYYIDAELRTIPNGIANAGLFSAIVNGRDAKKPPRFVQTPIPARSDTGLIYTGPTLDETQADLWMQLMHIAVCVTGGQIGHLISARRSDLLRFIGRGTDDKAYAWLETSLHRLSEAMIEVELRNKSGEPIFSGAMRLIEDYSLSDIGGIVTYRMNPSWCGLYAPGRYAIIDLAVREKFGRNQYLAKALQRIILTSNKIHQHHKLTTLKDRTGYAQRRIYDFTRAITGALRELERIGIISNAGIAKNKKGEPIVFFDRARSEWGATPYEKQDDDDELDMLGIAIRKNFSGAHKVTNA